MTEECVFDNGTCKWYYNIYFQKYLTTQQSDNLPILNGLGCFNVKGNDIDDIVLIDNKQNIVKSFKNSSEGTEQMEVFINMLKIDKHFGKTENINAIKRKRKYIK